MRTKILCLIIIATVCYLSACNNTDKSIKTNKLEVYILRHVEDSNDFVIDETPIFTGEDILNYEWDTHIITFKEEFIELHQTSEMKDDFLLGGSKILNIHYPDQFAVFVDSKELYRGYICPPAHISFMPMGPMICDSDDGIIIKCFDKNLDTRDNDILKEFLKDNDLLI